MTTQVLQTLDHDQFQAAVKAARDRFAMLKAKHLIPGKLDTPVAALFLIVPADPEAGSIGHTIRACRLAGVHVIF